MDSRLLHDLTKLLGPRGVLHQPEDLLLYEYDGSVEIARPDCVVFPRATADVVEIVRLANRYKIPLVGRGAGTGLSGGAIARHGGIIVSFARMNRILEIDAENQRATVQPGVVNADLSAAVEHLGLHFAPDPSSQKACTIGGNVSENSGGPHTLAYGVTTNHVLALEIVLPSGELVRLGSAALDPPGYDLTGLFVGSEGTFALVTEITVKLTRMPEAVKTLLAVFDSVDDATETVVDITARGITPAACEMLDGWTLRAVEDYVHAGFPLDCAAVLLIEVDGLREVAEAQAEEVADVCRAASRARSARGSRRARARPAVEGPQERLRRGRPAFADLLHAGRRDSAHETSGHAAPHRRRSARNTASKSAIFFMQATAICTPLFFSTSATNSNSSDTIRAGDEIIEFCIEMGGSITGEHGVGMEKDRLMPLLFSEADLALMRRVRDAFNPAGLLNPGKILPTSKGCGEIYVRPRPAAAAPSA